ncbi:MAG: ABC transporter permease [Ignavibacteriaceae bacterium]|jgi:peptide/nickel transport system permease protein|nr:MAG: ABC transporter permease [Chlorobiota bacterium]KXK04557.1 MAG: peptide/nickel transport system permease protein [Chlorobi bacterium OLB4]MBV6399379.1 Glutathione transport system permease protein GsiC [Ignavibacteria bacterium]MCC6886868.1 ABC transporter permease [Ignavibacteriales bacterium]MCE7953923.1 ABC transporter permease [Chlorobi bacterium CHB7]MDL1887856.1 ABC transporter permease [Ignavibacteria bacterium CHB1]MEB2330513.1 ABC transporter permease [Ignavibacteriaceae bact
MWKFIVKNFLYSLLVIIGVITVTFALLYIVPGDPARMLLGQRADEESVKRVKEELGLDKPITTQYLNFIMKAAQGDLGRSYATNREVAAIIIEKFPATALLAISAMLLSSILGVIIGVISAIRSYSFTDNASMVFALFGISIPQFVFALLMALVFGSILKWLPISGYITDGWDHLILPMLTLALRPLAIIARITRSSMLDVLNQDYIRTAKAKGLSEMKVVFKHSLRNALTPVVTTLSASLAATLGGAFFIEFIFNWPGIGLLAIDSILKLDFPMIQGTVLFSAIIFVLINFLVDIIYAFLDPKVKLA